MARAARWAQAPRALSERHNQAALKREQRTQERSKSEQRSRLVQLTAFVDGTAQKVAVHTKGGVVTPTQVPMVNVPADAQMSAEVTVDNKDIGFVRPGQVARIKLETFPFNRFAAIPATVQRMTADAVTDDQRGATFPATLSLDASTINIDSKTIKLSPGMSVTAEVRTRARRVSEYLMSPLNKVASERLHER